MLVTLKEILKIAEDRKIAVGSFNTPNMASVKAVIAAAEDMNSPVILMHAQVHEDMGLCKMEEIAPVMLLFAKNAKVPVCVHLDHGTDIEYVKKGLELGFTSVMYDGSTLSAEENTANTKIVVEEAKKTGASVEAEIGSMGAREGGGAGGGSIYTDPEQAKAFAEETKIDAEYETLLKQVEYSTYDECMDIGFEEAIKDPIGILGFSCFSVIFSTKFILLSSYTKICVYAIITQTSADCHVFNYNTNKLKCKQTAQTTDEYLFLIFPLNFAYFY